MRYVCIITCFDGYHEVNQKPLVNDFLLGPREAFGQSHLHLLKIKLPGFHQKLESIFFYDLN